VVDLPAHTSLGQPPTPTGLWDTLTACDRARGVGRVPGVAVAMTDARARTGVLSAVAVAAAAAGACVIVAEQASEQRLMLPSMQEAEACQAMLWATITSSGGGAGAEQRPTLLVLPSLALAALPAMRKLLTNMLSAPHTYLCVGVDPADPPQAYVLCQPQDLMVVRTDEAVLLQNSTHDEIVRGATGG
jgi:hypothetical protein